MSPRKSFVTCLAAALLFGVVAGGQELRTLNGVQRLYWRGEPFVMLSGELHNSTSTTHGYLDPTMRAVKAMGLNSVIVTVEWDQLEPEEGKWDFSRVDDVISLSEELELPVVIAWFGTWKNGVSSYVPSWVKRDTKRFFRVRDKGGVATDVISPFCKAALKADAKAYAALMAHIAERDTEGMVLFMQVENEVGLWTQDIDYEPTAQEAFSGDVPAELVKYLSDNDLSSPIKADWTANGGKVSASWTETFGDTPSTKAYFMAWHYAKYCDAVAEAGRAECDIPMYMNTVAMPSKMPQLPGVNPNKSPDSGGAAASGEAQATTDGPAAADAAPPAGGPFGGMNPNFPSGAPVAGAIDIYHAAAPHIDFYSPDIYAPGAKGICDDFTRADNPLFIPENGRDAQLAYYALAEDNAIGYSAFAVEDAYLNHSFTGTYSTLNELLPLISEMQGTGLMRGFMREGAEMGTSFVIGGYTVSVEYIKEEPRSFGLVAMTSEGEFIVSGLGAFVEISRDDDDVITRYDFIEEGHFEDGGFVPEVLLNGDQTTHGRQVYLRGRMAYSDSVEPLPGEVFPKRNVASNEAHQDIVVSRPREPSVCRAVVYTYPK